MITAVTGLNGAGKTAYAVAQLRKFQSRGYSIAANIDVSGATLLRNFDDVLALRDCIVLIDEITAVASSRQFASLSPEALVFFQTLRHSNLGVFWTAPTYDRADIALRSLTLSWVHLSPLFSRSRKLSPWRDTLVSFGRRGRPAESADGAKMITPVPFLFRPSKAFEHYDSHADVDLFQRVPRFPRSCPACGLSLSYGRGVAQPFQSLAPQQLSSQLFCPRCGVSLPV